MKEKPRRAIGWREWVSLPDLDVSRVKAKVDTGARTSSLHAVDLEVFSREGRPWVRFVVHPLQRTIRGSVEAEAPILEEREVRSSNGHLEMRPVIETDLIHGAERWRIELTLTSRAVMGFRMLLGREALRGRALVDPGRSYLGGEPVL